MTKGSIRRMLTCRCYFKAIGNNLYTITMAHPHLMLGCSSFKSCEKSFRVQDSEVCFTKFMLVSVFHLAAKLLYHELGSVADSQDWQVKIQDGRI